MGKRARRLRTLTKECLRRAREQYDEDVKKGQVGLMHLASLEICAMEDARFFHAVEEQANLVASAVRKGLKGYIHGAR